jgi:hypothetical protein
MKFSCNSILTFLTALFLCAGPLFADAQNIRLKDNISFSVNNVPVSDALEALTRVTGFTFSYNPDQIPASRIVKVDLINRPVIEVLNAILGSQNFGYRQMANQIVIYLAKQEIVPNGVATTSETQPSIAAPITKETDKNQNQVFKPDTVYITKNIRDTVKVKEVIVKTDTVYEKIITPVSGNEIFSRVTDLKKELTPVWKVDAGVSFSLFLPGASYQAHDLYSEKLDQYKKSFSNKAFSGSAGIDVRASYGKWTAASGIALTLFSQKLDYNYLIETGGFYQKDTLDKYYTLSGIDTTWYYILDSAYVPKDNEQFNYRMNNHIRYLEIPLAVHYNYGFRSMLLYAKAGIIPGVYTGSDGQQIMPDSDGVIPVKQIEAKSIVLSYIFGLGVAVPLSRKLVLNSSIFYRNHFSSIYKDFPIETRYSAAGIQAGIIYKLY